MLRTRFAPSPTGYLHIGGLRTCLYTYLLAKKHGGAFILRIEDTDQTRFIEGATESLIDILETMGMEFDEGPIVPTSETYKPIPGDKTLTYLGQKGDKGPYIQSQRTAIYQKYAQELLDQGKAYYCFCTSEELDKMREEQTAMKLAPMYDRRCLKLSPEDVKARLDLKTPVVIRQKISRDKKIEFKDHIRGKVSFMGSTIDDQILLKSDQLPTYHLANVVDDHLMEITHVIRGEEWLTSTPKHLELYEAFGWQAPEYAHLPLILNADKTKLSKRQNDVSVESYLQKGYLKEALINFVALLGWHPGKGVEQEIFGMDDLIEQFSLEHVNKAGAVFNKEKLDWFNFQWQKKLHFEKLTNKAKEIDPNCIIKQRGDNQFEYSFSSAEFEKTFLQFRAQLLSRVALEHLNENYKTTNADTEDNSTELSKLSKALLVNEEKILKNPQEIHHLIEYFYHPKPLDESLLLNPKMKVESVEGAKESLKMLLELLKNFEEFDKMEEIGNHIRQFIEKSNLKTGQILWPMRVALTREQFSVGAFEAAWVLGKTETLKRLEEVLK